MSSVLVNLFFEGWILGLNRIFGRQLVGFSVRVST